MIDLSEYEDRYSRLTLGQSMKIGWRRMKEILFKPFSIVAILSFSLLGLFARLGGGEKLASTTSIPNLARIVFQPFFSSGQVPLVACITVLVAAFFIWLYIEARLRLIYLAAIAQKEIRFFQSWKQLKTAGRSLFHWEFVVACIAIAYILAISIGGRYFGRSYYPLAFMGSLGFLLLVDFSVIRLVMPLMFIKNIKLVSALKLFQKLYGDNKSSVLSFFFSSLGIHSGIMIALFAIRTILYFLGVFLFSARLFGASANMAESMVSFIITYFGLGVFLRIVFGIFLQPIQLWYQAWALAFYAGFGDDLNAFVTNRKEDAFCEREPVAGWPPAASDT